MGGGAEDQVLGSQEARATGWAETELKSLPMGRKQGKGEPIPQGLEGATRNMLGQRPAGTPRGVGNSRLHGESWTLGEAMPPIIAVDTSLLEHFL